MEVGFSLRSPGSSHQLPVAGCRLPVAGFQLSANIPLPLETGPWKLEPGDRRLTFVFFNPTKIRTAKK
jgi:hypothetical protein